MRCTGRIVLCCAYSLYSEAIEFFFRRIFLCLCVCMHAWVGNDLIILANLPPFALLSIAIYTHLQE